VQAAWGQQAQNNEAARMRRFLIKEDQMVRHVVMWKIKATDERTKEENLAEMKKRILALKGEVEVLKEIAVGINYNRSDMAYDIVLESEFDSKEDLNAYQVHPKHVEVAGFVRLVSTDRVVVDYEV
jgi:hypothetical protein